MYHVFSQCIKKNQFVNQSSMPNKFSSIIEKYGDCKIVWNNKMNIYIARDFFNHYESALCVYFKNDNNVTEYDNVFVVDDGYKIQAGDAYKIIYEVHEKEKEKESLSQIMKRDTEKLLVYPPLIIQGIVNDTVNIHKFTHYDGKIAKYDTEYRINIAISIYPATKREEIFNFCTSILFLDRITCHKIANNHINIIKNVKNIINSKSKNEAINAISLKNTFFSPNLENCGC